MDSKFSSRQEVKNCVVFFVVFFFFKDLVLFLIFSSCAGRELQRAMGLKPS